ncbi:DUF5776 domain-containing protein [Levilactobacillus namurensis]|uniref:DUF5776 domain-containing protein n=1 Tax=Levilactobacillus namurensis TaxID=380393 RepID=UPI001D81D39D|nr:DUF5776 domain-containing protein [Levilactobacillus namurensis]HJE45156.1 DUF5776 domain-containing protein [Levilactobacillus namurensis]
MRHRASHWVALGVAVLAGSLWTTNVTASTTNLTATPGSQVTQTAAQEYPIGEVELPYALLYRDGQLDKSYLVPQAPKSLTLAQLADQDYLDQIMAGLPADQAEMFESLQSSLEDFLEDPVVLKPGERIVDFLVSREADNEEMTWTADEFKELMGLQAFQDAWFLSQIAQYQVKGMTEAAHADLVANYQQNLRPRLSRLWELAQPEGMSEDKFIDAMDMMIMDKQAFDKYTIPGMRDPLMLRYGVTNDSPETLSQWNPARSEKLMLERMEAPMTDYLTKDSAGTYRIDGFVLSMMAGVLGDVDPIIPPDPGEPEPTPEPTPEPNPEPAPEPDPDPEPDPNPDGNGNAGGGDGVAAKGTVVTATRKIGLYRTKNFTTQTRRQWYAKKARPDRPMFVVTGYARTAKGTLRYQVRDVNHQSKTRGLTGYVTAKAAYVTPTYYQGRHAVVTVINPQGANAYRQKNLTQKVRHFRQGQVVKVKRIVRHRLTTRFVLTDGTYLTANKKLVQAGKRQSVQKIRVRRAIYRYQTTDFTQRKQRYTAGQTLKVVGWAYSHPTDLTQGSTLRYRVAGGYVTANAKYVQVIK